MSPVLSGDRDRDRLEQLLGSPEMAWLLGRVRERALTAGGEPLTGMVRLKTPTAPQRDGAIKLVGRPKRAGAALRLDLAEVEEVLRRGPWPAGLTDAVVTLTGPLIDHRAERESEATAWALASAKLMRSAGRFPGLGQWWSEWCSAGGLKRAARSEARRLGVSPGPEVAEQLVGDLADILNALPAPGVPIAVFARQLIGDAHALDASRPLGRLTCTVVGAACGAGEGTEELSPREVWASAGVVMSTVSSTALVLGAPGVKGSYLSPLGAATSSVLEAMRAARSPVVLTLDQVRSGGVAALPPEGVVHVCENPTIIEVIARQWASRQPEESLTPGLVLVCSSGQPTTAVIELLEALMADGAKCRYHGDFDWAGLRIAGAIASRIPWTPWRFTAVDYLAATRASNSRMALSGPPVETPWDVDLAPTMARVGLAVEEEAVAELLSADLLGFPTT